MKDKEHTYDFLTMVLVLIGTCLMVAGIVSCCSTDTRSMELLYSCHEYDVLQAADSTLLVVPKEKGAKPYIINIKE